MSSPDWQSLIVSVNDRSTIYAEHFPATLAGTGEDVVSWFSHDQADQLLFTFAGAWPSLGRDTHDPSVRYVYLSNGTFVCRFRASELRSAAIVVDDVVRLRHDDR